MDSKPASRHRWWIWCVDAVVVVSFAVIGRDSHGFTTDWGEVIRISTPFIIALAASAAALVWVLAPRLESVTPISAAGGAWMGIATLAIGMALRRFVFDDGTATTFIVITAGWLIGLMVGWRLAYLYGRRLVTSRA